MLFLDHLDEEQTREVRKILHAEDFGTNEVDIQQDGRVYMTGYFTPHDLQLIGQVAERIASEQSMH
jgi:hypothetical protein